MIKILSRYPYHPSGGFRLVEDSFSNVPIDKDQVNTWTEFLQDPQFKYYDKIQEIANLYPEVTTLEVNYWDIQKFNDEFAETFLNKPRSMIPNAEKAIADLCPADVEGEFHFRVKGLPAETARLTLPDLRAHHLEKYVAVEGLVRSRTEVRPRLTIAIFRCQKCGYNMRIPQEDNLLREPFMCVNENCNREAKQTSFELVKTVSEYVDLQTLNIQEPPEGLRGSAPPQRLKIFLRDDLCGRVSPGERIIINGILFASQRKVANQKSTDFDLFIDAFAIEQEKVPYEEIQISAEEMNEINEMAKNPLIYELIRDSIAPGIFEMDIIKEALVLQLFGGIAKDTDTSHNRGDIHILLIGDPGTGKSQLLRYMSKIAPRGIFASGKSASAAGLTATAVKDELDGRWTIEGGALVLADRGVACIDEIDKMREEDRVAIHEALEQQSISFAKAGITATLMTRCSLLAAANPKEGRFSDDKSYPEQINLLPTLLSRFDLIFPIIDKPDEDKDHRLASKILDSHRAGQMRKNIKENKEVDYSSEEAEQIARSEPAIPTLLLQKYVAYAKRNIFPVMTEDVKERLLDYYVNQRALGKPRDDEEGEVERITLTPRQLEGLIRLSEASAKLRHSNVVDMEDAERAITLFTEYLNRSARDKSGKLDIDTIMSGTSARKRNYGKIMRSAIQDLIKNPDIDTTQGVHISDLRREAIAAEIPEDEFDDLLNRLNDKGDIYKPTEGYYRLTK